MPKPNYSISNGQIYKLGEHLLACGDSTDEVFVKKVLGNNKIDLLLTDPPYGVNYVESKLELGIVTSKNKTIENDGLSDILLYKDFSRKWLKSVVHNLSSYNTYYIFNGDKMLFALHDVLSELDFKFSQLLIWIKSQPVLGRKDYMPQHELILYGWLGKHSFRKSKDRSLLFEPKPTKNSLHPTMKPISLLRRLILNSTALNSVVYDPFAGSGSTLIACEQAQRKCITIESDTSYCQTIVQRYKKLTGINAVLLN